MQAEAEQASPKRPLEEPYLIPVPDIVADRIDRMIQRVARRTGEPTDKVRRACELSVLTRGLDAFEGEEGLR
jgi:hypothetical protein